MNIGIVCYPTFGGSGVIATELGMAFAKEGHNVHFITYKQPVKLNFIYDNIHFHEVFVEEYPLFHFQPYELALSTKMVEVALAYDLEIFHVHYAIPHAYAAYMAKKILEDKGLSIKVITTLHGTDITLVGSHPNYKAAVEFSINYSDGVTTVSESLKKDTLRLFQIKKNIQVIYNFIDFSKKKNLAVESCKREALATKDEKIICHISNLRAVKRGKDVIHIFNKVKQEIASKLMIIGDGPDREQMELLAKELGILDSILFLGNSNDTFTILNYSDLFLLPSETESFGLVALEAMATGTPVISTNSGGLREVNIEGETGFLSNVGAIDEMTKNAVKLLRDEKLLSQFKENAINHAKKFDIKSILPAYQKIYEDTIKLGD